MILIALRTGLRQGELLGLRWEVDLVAGRIVVCRSIVRGRVGLPKSGKQLARYQERFAESDDTI